MAAPVGREQKFARERWTKLFHQALDADTWGQTLEASDEYERLLRSIDQSVGDLKISIDQRNVVSKIRHAVSMRMEALQDIKAENEGLKLEDMKKLTDVFDGLFVKPLAQFPIELRDVPLDGSKKSSNADNLAEILNNAGEVAEAKEAAVGPLLRPPSNVPAGQTTISIYIDKIGLKDAMSYVDARLTISVEDKGKIVEEQSTPDSNKRKSSYIAFQETVYIQKPFDLFTKDMSIFFELKHFKQQKNKLSTRCFAFLEYEEIAKAGDACLELYKKPTDFSKKKLSLLTVKLLYLHIRITLHKH